MATGYLQHGSIWVQKFALDGKICEKEIIGELTHWIKNCL